ncbi:phage protein [Vibrio rumoiensis]|uniref:phage protein n=1 Tax=Vibrio rumoiensis TaxID=76258 RepID=UPI000B5C2C5F|nr:phage protein [Vibrio rumoiensis]
MKYHEMTKNFIFRELECGLSIEETAKLCFKTVRTITEWDRGKTIPPECKRLMRLYCGRELGTSNDWEGFKMNKQYLITPYQQSVTPQQILLGLGLVEIKSELELKTSSKILKIARAISVIKKGK